MDEPQVTLWSILAVLVALYIFRWRTDRVMFFTTDAMVSHVLILGAA